MQEALIERYLQSIDQATFQKLMDNLLINEGFKFLGAPGEVVAKNKTRTGTPDSFFADSDKFIFCEYTTQERVAKKGSFIRKLKKDIDHCFNVSKTGIEKSKISKVILGFTGVILPKELLELENLVKTHNSTTEILTYSIQQLPHKILSIPGLADKYIPGLKTTKGAISTLKDFLFSTQRGVQPALTNPFIGREDEIKKAQTLLEQADVLILTGHQGVGKSKLAVYLAELYEAKRYQARVIGNGPIPAWDDLQNLILPNQNYVIVFDDANKALNNLVYLIQFLKQRQGVTPKVIITVRDYVRNTLNPVLINTNFSELSIEKLDGKQIKEIVQKSLPQDWTIFPQALERIEDLSKGNSRLALMSTAAILKNPELNLSSAEELYDAYFKQLANDVSILHSSKKLTALGILSFFGVIHRTNDKLQSILEIKFQINWNQLWATFLELDDAELVEVHSNEIVKISDQVLGTYVFYKAFFDPITSIVSYSEWLKVFLGKHNSRIRNSMVDLIRTYGYHEMKDRVSGHLIVTQQSFVDDHEKLYDFFELFWFYRDIDTLSFVQHWIDSLGTEDFIPDKNNLADIAKEHRYSTKYVELLTPFWSQHLPLSRQALEMGMEISIKRPSRLEDMMKFYNDNLIYHRYDYQINYTRQQNFLDVINEVNRTATEIFIADQIFLSIAGQYLEWDCTEVQGNSGGSMSIFTFSPFANEPFLDYRKMVLSKLFSLFVEFERKVLEILEQYVWAGREFNSEVFQAEQTMFAEFIDAKLSTNNYRHCKLVRRYERTLREHDIPLVKSYSEFLDSRIIRIATVFTHDDDEFDLRKRDDKKRQEMSALISNLDSERLKDLFTIVQNIDNNSDEENALQLFMITLADENLVLFDKGVDFIMSGDFKVSNNEGWFISEVVTKKHVRLEDFYKKISFSEYKQKEAWKKSFFQSIPVGEVTNSFLEDFIDFLKTDSPHYYAVSFHEYDKYTSAFLESNTKSEHHNFVTYAADILLDRAQRVNVFFDRHLCERCLHFFNENVSLLKRVYIHQARMDVYGHFDYNGTELKAVCSLDRSFLTEYIGTLSQESPPGHFKIDDLNLLFIWEYENYEAEVDALMEIIIEASPPWSNFKHTANTIFKQGGTGIMSREKMLSYISHFISTYSQSRNHMVVIMNVLACSFPEQRIKFFKEMVQANSDIDIYRNMSFETARLSGSTLIPGIEMQISFTKVLIETLKSLPSPLKYSALIGHYENLVLSLLEHKERELKNDFVGWHE